MCKWSIYEWMKTFTSKITISTWLLFIHKSLPVKSNAYWTTPMNNVHVNLWASGANQPMNNNAWKEFGLNIGTRNAMFNCSSIFGDMLSSNHCQDGNKFAQPGKFSNEIENCLIALPTQYVCFNQSKWRSFLCFEWMFLFFLFRQLNPTTNVHFSW